MHKMESLWWVYLVADPGEFFDTSCSSIHTSLCVWFWKNLVQSLFLNPNRSWFFFHWRINLNIELNFLCFSPHRLSTASSCNFTPSQLTYPGSASVFLFKHRFFYYHANAMWLLISRSVFWKHHRFFVGCTQTHNHNRTTTRTLLLSSWSRKPMYFI